MNGLEGIDMQWTKESMNGGMLTIILVLDSYVASVINRLTGVKKMRSIPKMVLVHCA